MKHGWVLVVVALALVAAVFAALPAPGAWAGSCTSLANGNWSDAATWGAGCSGTGGVPGSGDAVTVAHTVSLTAAASVGAGTVTVQSGAVLNLSSFALTAASLTIDNGAEVQQGGTSTAPAGTITTRAYAPESIYTFNGTQVGLSGTTHPTYGNLNFAPTPSSAGTFGVSLNVAGNMTINLGSAQEVRFATGTTARTHTIGGNLNIQNGIVVGSNGSSAAGTATVTIGRDLNITGGTFRGTNDAGNATFNIAGNLFVGGTWQQDDGSSAGVFAVNLDGASSSQSVGGAATFSFENLTLNNALGCTLDRNVDVTGQLALTSGNITTGANTLILTEAATTAGTGDVWGNVKRTGALATAKSYSFGNPNVSLNFTSATTMPTDVTINLAAGTPSGFANAVSRNYSITPSGGSDYSATVRLRYLDTELGSNVESQLRLWRYDGATWVDQGGAVDTTNNHVEVSGVTAFSPWAVSSGQSTAVTLRTLSAAPQGVAAALPLAGLALLGGLAAFMRRLKA